MGSRGNMVLLNSQDPEIAQKVKALKNSGWCFVGKQGDEFIYEKYKNPLFQFKFSHVFVLISVLVAFIAMLTRVLFH